MALIIVIDDEEMIRKVIAAALKREGHAILEASDGAEALTLLKDTLPDLILTDIFMPERDGLEVIMSLQKDKRKVPIVAMTGAPDNAEMYLKAAKGLGASRILAKPFSIETLVRTINEALANRTN